MRITYIDDLSSGIDRFLPLLNKRSVLYAQLIGILVRIRRRPETFRKEKPHLWLVENSEGELIGGACRTPPHPLQFSVMDDDVFRALASQVVRDDPSCPGVIGPVPQVMTLANAFELGENPTEVRLNMTLYGLTKLNVKPQRHLTLRKAQRRDFELVAAWLHRFAVDCDLPDGPMASERIRQELDEGRIDLAFDQAGKPVLMFKAVLLEETRTLRIGAVYAPDEERGKGYATEGIAQVIDRLLGTDVDAVTLFADKGNPVSNRLYLNLGFEHYADILMMTWSELR